MALTATKPAVTVPSDRAREINKAVVCREMERRKLRAYLRRLDRKLGPVPTAVMARARASWPER